MVDCDECGDTATVPLNPSKTASWDEKYLAERGVPFFCQSCSDDYEDDMKDWSDDDWRAEQTKLGISGKVPWHVRLASLIANR